MTDGLTLAEAISRSEQARSLRIRPRRASTDTIEFLHALTAAPDVGFDRYRAHVLSLVSGLIGATKLYRWALDSPKASDVSASDLYRAALFGSITDRIPGDTAVLDPASVPLNVAPCEWAEALYWTEIVLDGDIPALAEWHLLRATGIAAINEITRRQEKYSSGMLLYDATVRNDGAALTVLQRRIKADIAHAGQVVPEHDTDEIIIDALGDLLAGYRTWPDANFGLWLDVLDGRVSPGLWGKQRWRNAYKRRKRSVEMQMPAAWDDASDAERELSGDLEWNDPSPGAAVPIDVSVSSASRLCSDLSGLPGLEKPVRVVRAYLQAFSEGIDEPKQKDVAARLRVTERTVYSHLARLREPQNREALRRRLTEGKDTRSNGVRGWTWVDARRLYRAELRRIHGLVYRRGAHASRLDDNIRELAAGHCKRWHLVGVFCERLRLPVQDGSPAGSWWLGLSREQLQTAVAARRAGLAAALAAEPTLRALWASTNQRPDSFPVLSPRVA